MSDISIVYRVKNKTFGLLYKTREDAEAFMKEHGTVSNGLEIEEVQVLGAPPIDREKALQEKASELFTEEALDEGTHFLWQGFCEGARWAFAQAEDKCESKNGIAPECETYKNLTITYAKECADYRKELTDKNKLIEELCGLVLTYQSKIHNTLCSKVPVKCVELCVQCRQSLQKARAK